MGQMSEGELRRAVGTTIPQRTTRPPPRMQLALEQTAQDAVILETPVQG